MDSEGVSILNAQGNKKITLEWFQTESQIIIEINIDNPLMSQCKHKITDSEFKFKYLRENGSMCIYKYILHDIIYPDETVWSFTDTKIIIILVKVIPRTWFALEIQDTCTDIDEEYYYEEPKVASANKQKSRQGLRSLALKSCNINA